MNFLANLENETDVADSMQLYLEQHARGSKGLICVAFIPRNGILSGEFVPSIMQPVGRNASRNKRLLGAGMAIFGQAMATRKSGYPGCKIIAHGNRGAELLVVLFYSGNQQFDARVAEIGVKVLEDEVLSRAS